jgi:catechol 1,2-dioxygenase
VKESLIRDVQRVDDPALANDYGVTNPFDLIEFDVVLEPTTSPDHISLDIRGD